MVDRLETATPFGPTPDRVLDVVAHMYEIPREELTGRGRQQPLALRRQVAAWLMRDRLGMSYPKIARAVGWKDHTTAWHAVLRVDKALLEDDQLWREVDTLRELVGRRTAVAA